MDSCEWGAARAGGVSPAPPTPPRIGRDAAGVRAAAGKAATPPLAPHPPPRPCPPPPPGPADVLRYSFAASQPALGAALFLPWAAWVCAWASALLALLALGNACAAISAFTRFSGESFGMLIAVLFMQVAVKVGRRALLSRVVDCLTNCNGSRAARAGLCSRGPPWLQAAL
jgi:hypothetical protein